MKKTFKFYFIIWTVLLVLFNIISFIRIEWTGVEKYTPSFWIGYIFIFISFISQMVCTYFALKDNNLRKTFYNISLITTSYTGLILSFVFGGLCMVFSMFPYWLSILLCAFVLGFNIIAIVKAVTAVNIVSDIDEKVKESTLFIKSLTVDAENLMARANSETAKLECKKVYEAVRYSDPMSSSALASIESEITIKFSKLINAVASDNSEAISELVNEIVILVSERNKKCKLLK